MNWTWDIWNVYRTSGLTGYNVDFFDGAYYKLFFIFKKNINKITLKLVNNLSFFNFLFSEDSISLLIFAGLIN